VEIQKVTASPYEHNCFPPLDECSEPEERSRKGFAWLVRPRLAFANLGHPYGVATTSATAPVRCFVNLPPQVVGSDDKVREGLLPTQLALTGIACAPFMKEPICQRSVAPALGLIWPRDAARDVEDCFARHSCTCIDTQRQGLVLTKFDVVLERQRNSGWSNDRQAAPG
jgi:hypothetical protein